MLLPGRAQANRHRCSRRRRGSHGAPALPPEKTWRGAFDATAQLLWISRDVLEAHLDFAGVAGIEDILPH